MTDFLRCLTSELASAVVLAWACSPPVLLSLSLSLPLSYGLGAKNIPPPIPTNPAIYPSMDEVT